MRDEYPTLRQSGWPNRYLFIRVTHNEHLKAYVDLKTTNEHPNHDFGNSLRFQDYQKCDISESISGT